MAEKPPAKAEKPTLPKRLRKIELRTLLPIAAGILLVVALIALILAMAIRSLVAPEQSAGIPLEVTRVFVSSLPTPSSPPVAEVGGDQMSLPVPILLEAGGDSFSVQPSPPGQENPFAIPPRPGTVTWAYGTVINYVLGTEPSSENREMLEGLGQGDPVLLHLSNGTRLTFRVADIQETSPDDPAIFSQSHTGLTIVLPDGEEQWLVVTADFEAAMEPTPVPGGTTVGVGQAVQVGDARITVTEGHVERVESLPPGTMAYLVEFSVANTGSTPLNADGFLMELVDGTGNRYLLSPAASSAGRFGPPSGLIQPGQERSGSAGYVVPTTLAGPALTWVFGPEPGSEVRAYISIPYTPETATPSAPEVDVLQAFLGEGGDVLHIVAEIHNAGGSDLRVTSLDISLSSSAGPGELQVAAPPFPWTIGAGATREVELQFARPEASACIITILGYTFEISGLP